MRDMARPYPTATQIRDALLDRAAQYRSLTGTSYSEIGKRAVGDKAFLFRLQSGNNFTIDVYSRVNDWLDASWPAGRKARQSARADA